MKTIKLYSASEVAKVIKKSGFRVINVVPWSDCTDGMVEVTGSVHVQVGQGYYSVVSQDASGKFRFYPSRSDLKLIVRDLSKIVCWK